MRRRYDALDPLDEVSELLSALLEDGSALVLLREDGDNRDARVATNDGDVDVLGVLAGEARDEGRGSDDVCAQACSVSRAVRYLERICSGTHQGW